MGFHEKGFGLLEVLISILVLTIGLLGIASLQGNAIRYNQSAQLRAIAIAQGNSMVDRLKANRVGVLAGNYNSITSTGSLPSCTTCTPSEIAQRDAYEWNSANAQMLPSGQGTVLVNGNNYIITVRWDGTRSGVNGTGCSGNTKADLSCFILEVQI